MVGLADTIDQLKTHRVYHDVLMHCLSRRIGDKAALGLIRRFLQVGAMHDAVATRRETGSISSADRPCPDL